MKVDVKWVIALLQGVFSAIAKYPQFLDEWEDVKAEWEEALSPDSEGGERITLGEFFNEIMPEFKEAVLVFVPKLDEIIDMFDKD